MSIQFIVQGDGDREKDLQAKMTSCNQANKWRRNNCDAVLNAF